jgi:hypothetical protein
MAEAVLEIVSRADGLLVRLLMAGNNQPAPENRRPWPLPDQEPPDPIGGKPLTVETLEPEWVAALNPDATMIVGRFLFALAFPEPVERAWRARRAECIETGEGLTTLLEVRPPEEGAPDLRNLPWELLLDTADDDALWLFRDEHNPMGLKIPASASGLSPVPDLLYWPLRMLVIVGTTSDPDIAWEEELLGIRQALAAFSLRVDLTVVKAPLSKSDATQAITRVRPHLLHFIGHGNAPSAGRTEGALQLDDGQACVEWKRSEIRAALTALRPPPRIVVINACEGAGPGTSAVAAAFAHVDCPAVIAMRGKIPGASAACFSAAFYGALADTGVHRPDLAYVRALQRVSTEPTNGDRAWFLPRLFFQRGVAEVFPGLGDGRGFLQYAAKFVDLMPLKPFVDRDDERARLYHGNNCWLGQAQPASKVLLVEGESGVGKSWLLKCLVFVAQMQGWHTVYWDFQEPPLKPPHSDEGQRHYDLEAVLLALREGKPWSGEFFAQRPWSSSPAPGIQPPGPFTDLDALLNSAAGTTPRGNEDSKSPKVQAFLRGLTAIARQSPGQPLFVALDHLSWITPDAWKLYLHRELVLPVARGQPNADIRLIIAGTREELGACQLDTLRPLPILASLAPFQGKQCADLMFNFLLHYLDNNQQSQVAQFRDIAQATAARIGDNNWKPSQLDYLVKLLDLKLAGGLQ